MFVCRGLLHSFRVVFYAFCCNFVKRLGAAVKKSAPWMEGIAIFLLSLHSCSLIADKLAQVYDSKENPQKQIRRILI